MNLERREIRKERGKEAVVHGYIEDEWEREREKCVCVGGGVGRERESPLIHQPSKLTANIAVSSNITPSMHSQ